MEDNKVQKLMTKIKNKFSQKQKAYPSMSEYVFSPEEIDHLSQENKKKILELKQNTFSTKEYKQKIIHQKEEVTVNHQEENSLTKEDDTVINNIDVLEDTLVKSLSNIQEFSQKKEKEVCSSQEVISDDVKNKHDSNLEEKLEKKKEFGQTSFLSLSLEHQNLIMEKWNKIDLNEIDKDILYGKDLLNHNYTITYADDAARFIHKIRKEYEVVICYLIGFNNEKKGIMNQTIFSDKVDNEWHYLSSYIKMLEKIRGTKKE